MRFFWLMTLFLLGPVFMYAQTITGQVTDVKGDPLTGANVTVIGLSKGAATNENGVYKLDDVPAGEYTLRVTFIGYETKKVPAVLKKGIGRLVMHIQMEDQIMSLDELVVEATRADERTPFTYTDIDAEELKATNLGQDVPYLLRWTPSAVVTSDAGTGIGYTGIRIRGTDASRINITINGIPLNDAESQGVFWVNLPDFTSSTNSIQIQRGVGTSTNGAGAFGATINLNTTHLVEEPFAEVNASVGSFNTTKANLRFGTGLLKDKFTLDGRISRINSDGFIDRASADLESFYLSAAYWGDHSTLRFNVFSGQEITYQSWFGVPKDSLETNRTYNPAGTQKEGEPYENEVDNYQQDHYQLLYSNQFTPNWNLNLALNYTHGEGFFERYLADQFLSGFGLEPVKVGDETVETSDIIDRLWLDNDFYVGTYSANYLSNDNRLKVTLGGAYSIYEGLHFGELIWARFAGNSELGDRYFENDARKTDFNIFGKVNYEILYGLNAFLDLQYRTVDYTFLGLDENLNSVEQSVNLNFFNPKLGLVYALADNKSIYASYAVANREPSRIDFVSSTPSTRPESERLHDFELGYKQNWTNAQLGVNGYAMLYQDQLVLNGQVNFVGTPIRINVDESYRIGLEVVGGIELQPGLDLSGSFTISQNKIQAYRELVDVFAADGSFVGQDELMFEDTDLAYSPDLVAGGQLAYDIFHKNNKQKLELTLLGKYVGEQFIDNTSDSENVIEAYFFSDFRIDYVWNPSFMDEIGIQLQINNVFDAEYETNAWSYRFIDQASGAQSLLQGFFPQAGTNFLLGLRLRI